MSLKVISGYRHILFLSLLLMTMSVSYFLFTEHTKWQDLKGVAQSWRAFAKRGDRNSMFKYNTLDGEKANGPDFGIPGVVKNNKNDFNPAEHSTDNPNTGGLLVADDTNDTKQTKCPNGSVYFSNDLYDCDGIMKDARFKPKNKNNTFKDEIDQEMSSPPTLKLKQPTIQSNVKQSNGHNSAKNNNKRETKKEPKNIFVNCGGTFPKTLELFLDTYPKSPSYSTYTFLPENSYAVMYSYLPNHTVIPFEASFKNSSKNVDVKAFGADAETTQTIQEKDLAAWLKANTNEEDFVVLRVDSEDEIKILEHVVKRNSMKFIDKYYTARGINGSKQELKPLMETMRQMKLKAFKWDNDMETYSDFFLLNPNHIPVPGKRITLCQQKEDDEKFALFLYSPSASLNSIKAINLLHNFSPKDRLQLTIFLRYEVFKFGSFINMKSLFSTFHVGLYYDSEGSMQATDGVQYNQLRNKLVFVRRLFGQFDQTLQYILTGNNTNEKVVARIRKNLHYSFVQGGTDISHLTEKTLAGRTVSIDDTGKAKGDFLLVNIDTINAEYLVLYMVRRFAPWLLTIPECDVTRSGSLLNNKDAVVL
ncbi:uncharacterized protein LOC132753450 [Ruditapes philippinarum]|uniref:uncharacterized protein LOC132753450 n=1 Tax=Ruditapes philippinarum TaxID=129788 RepID=UPI00295B97CD|nr:uncharacterized protein LOC132753450 [Ruditapes philippinarum]